MSAEAVVVVVMMMARKTSGLETFDRRQICQGLFSEEISRERIFLGRNGDRDVDGLGDN